MTSLKQQIANQVTPFIRREYPLFVAFLEYYFEWLEQEDNPVDTIRNLEKRLDISQSNDLFISHFRKEVMGSIPVDIMADERLLMKHIAQLYRSKGSKTAYKLLFRILFNEDVDLYYPRENVFGLSSATWIPSYQTIYVNTTDDVVYYHGVGVVQNDIVDNKVVEVARATVDESMTYKIGSTKVTRLRISNYTGTFDANLNVLVDGGVHSLYVMDDDYTINAAGSVVITHPGYYLDGKGHASGIDKLPDGHYFQTYSYEIRTLRALHDYEKVVKKLIHPAGMRMYGKVVMDYTTDPLYAEPEPSEIT